MFIFNKINVLPFSSNLTPIALLATMGLTGLSATTIASAGITNPNPAPFSVENTATLCYVFPSKGATAVNQVPCSYSTIEPTFQKVADYKKKCRDEDTDSADLMKQSTSIQFTGYGIYEHISSDFVCSGQGDGWVVTNKEIKTFNKKPVTFKYRHETTGKAITEKMYSKAWEDYFQKYAKNQAISKPNYLPCVTAQGLSVDLCLPNHSIPDFTYKK